MSRQARDDGTSTALAVAGEAWCGLAEYFIYRYFVLQGSQGARFEEARAFAELCFSAKPPHPNAWGSLALRMASSGLIERTGDHRQSTLFRNHARSAAVWRVRHHTSVLAHPNPLLSAAWRRKTMA
jgi:hypothetical protein